MFPIAEASHSERTRKMIARYTCIEANRNKCNRDCTFMASIISRRYMHLRGPFVAGIAERVNRIHSRRINLRNPRCSPAVFADYHGFSGRPDALQQQSRNLPSPTDALQFNANEFNRGSSPKFMRPVFRKRVFSAERFIRRRSIFISQNVMIFQQLEYYFPRSTRAFIRYSFRWFNSQLRFRRIIFFHGNIRWRVH